eukprot:781441-Amphidinium_carterae.1
MSFFLIYCIVPMGEEAQGYSKTKAVETNARVFNAVATASLSASTLTWRKAYAILREAIQIKR